jgi:hypothetical protein
LEKSGLISGVTGQQLDTAARRTFTTRQGTSDTTSPFITGENATPTCATRPPPVGVREQSL